MILAEFINSKYYGSKEEYSDLVDFHTYTGQDVYTYNDYTISHFNHDEWNAQINYFFKYYRDELLKISNNLSEELCPVIIRSNGILQIFKDMDSFEKDIKNDIIHCNLFDWEGNRNDTEVKIILNHDNTIAIVCYTDDEDDEYESNDSDNYCGNILGYISKSTFDYLNSIPQEEKIDSCLSRDAFDLSLYEQITVNKLYFNADNDYYKTKVSIDIKDYSSLSHEIEYIKESRDKSEVSKSTLNLDSEFNPAYIEDVKFEPLCDEDIPF